MGNKQLERSDPIDKHYEDMFGANGHPDMKQMEKDAGSKIAEDQKFNDIANNYGKSADATQENENIRAAKQREEIPYRRTPEKVKGRFSGRLRKLGPAGGLAGILIGGFFGLGVLFSPSIAIIHLAEALTGDLSDALPAMDRRATKVFKAKLDKMGPTFGSCGLVKIRCELRGMTDKQIQNFRNAGIIVEVGEDTGFGKKHIKSLAFKVADSSACENCVNGYLKITDPSQLRKWLGNSLVQNQLRRAYNPKFYMMRDKVASVRLGKLHTSLGEKLKGTDKASIDADIDAATAGDRVETGVDRLTGGEDDTDETRANNEKLNGSAGELLEGIDSTDIDTASVFESTKDGAIKGIMITGTLDTACTVYNTSRAVSALSKVQKAMQAAQYAMIFLTFANQLKAAGETGDSTALAAQAAVVGGILTSIDSRAKVYNESSSVKGGTLQQVDNPDYGKSAFDAQAMKAALHNDAPKPTARTLSYSVGGGLTGSLDGVNKKIANVLGSDNPKEMSEKCGKIQNPLVRIGSAIIGVATGVVTFGWATALSVGGSVAISMAMPLLQSYLAGIVSGKLISSKLANVDAGNTIFSGTGTILGGIAMSRGMKPASKSDLKSYMTLSEEVNNEYVAMETEEAKASPFDITNQYSFLGSLSRKLVPLQTNTTVAGFINPIKTLSSITSGSLTPTASALSNYNADRYSQCSDDGYKALGIDADIMCNVRYVMSTTELNMETDAVIEEMVARGHVDPETGDAVSEEYTKWLEECTEREIGWGETTEENSDGDGSICMKDDFVSSLFRVYTMDRGIIEGMDNGPVTGTAGTTMEPTDITVASYNVLHSENFAPASRAIGGCNRNPVPDDPNCAKTRAGYISEIFNGGAGNPPFDIVGTQETSPEMYAALKEKLPTYGVFPGDSTRMNNAEDGGLAIWWNNAKLQQFTEGKAPGLSNTALPITNPWVGLKSGDKEIYVMSVHYATGACSDGNCDDNSPNATDEANMKESSRLTMDWVEQSLGENPERIVVVVGDFNDQLNQKLSYCVYTKSGLMQHAHDMEQKDAPSNNCNKPDTPGIDHIYISPQTDLSAMNWTHMDRKARQVTRGSDHEPVYATMRIGGSTGTVNTASFNILHSDGESEDVWKNRLTKSFEVLKTNSIDVAGLQEVRPNQLNAIKSGDFGEGTYDIWPTESKQPDFTPNPVIWNKSKFSMVEGSGTLRKIYYGDSHAQLDHVVQVKLKTTSGQEFYVVNTHDPADVQGGADIVNNGECKNINYRECDAKRHAAALKDLIAEGIPVIFTGDFNSRYGLGGGGNQPSKAERGLLTYCILANESGMRNAWDVFKKNAPGCPSTSSSAGNVVDHIYLSPGLESSNYWFEPNDKAKTGSDHPVIMSSVTLPGTSEGGTTPVTPSSGFVGNDGFPGGSCVAYVKYILGRHTTKYKGGSMGDGHEFAANLGSLGYTVNNTPAVHAVVSFPKSMANPIYGHVAIVGKINADGSIVVEEANWTNTNRYGTHTVRAADVPKLTYAHTEVDWK